MNDVNKDITYTKEFASESFFLEDKKMTLEAGILGKIFGSPQNAPWNIAGIFLILLLLSGIATLFFKTGISAPDFWKIITPIMTAILGFIFGKKT